jgi:hypothetical protein
MPLGYFTNVELHQLLCRQGHSFSERSSHVNENTDVCPGPDILVTIAVDPDGALPPDYRNRYFAFRTEYIDEPLPPCDKYFPIPVTLQMAALQDPSLGDFMAGPVRWLLHRLNRIPEIILWPMSSSLTYSLDGWIPEIFQRFPPLRRLHPKACEAEERAAAILLKHEDPADAQILWSVANHVSQIGDDFFVSGPNAEEVYLLHHHDEVVISIPDFQKRCRLLDELAGCSDILIDCSGYS